MQEEIWLEYLKEYRPDLYIQAKDYIAKQNEILEKSKLESQKRDIIIERYQNLIASNYLFSTK